MTQHRRRAGGDPAVDGVPGHGREGQRAQRVQRRPAPRPARAGRAPGAAAGPAGTRVGRRRVARRPAAARSVAGGSAATAASSSGVGGAAPAIAGGAGARTGRRPAPPNPAIAAAHARRCRPAAPEPTSGGSGHSSGVTAVAAPDGPRRRAGAGGRRAAPGTARSARSAPPRCRCRPRRPPSSTAIRSASASVERRCATSSVVRPAVSARSVSWMAASVAVSTAEVASSSTSTRGSVSIALASAIALPLAAGQGQPALADDGVVAVGQLLDEPVDLGGPGGGPHLLVGGVRAAVGDVGADGVGEQERLLEHHAELAAQLGQPQLGQRHPAQPQLAVAAGRRSGAAAAPPSTCRSPAGRPARGSRPARRAATPRPAPARRRV